MSNALQGNCWHCGRALTTADYGRENNCTGCSKPTRVCRNCLHYSPGRTNDCIEPLIEPVLEKERANFCELFEPTDRPARSATGSAAKELAKMAESLFK